MDNIKIAVSEPTKVVVSLTVSQELLNRWGASETPAGHPALEVTEAIPKMLEAALKSWTEKSEDSEETFIPVGSSLTVTIQLNS